MALKHLIVFTLITLIFFSFTSTASAQSSEERWAGLKDLESGTRVVVDRDGAESLKAKFAGSTEQTLSVVSKGKRIDIDRGNISAVYLGRKPSKLKRGLIGGLAGAGAGLLVGAVTIAATKGDPLIAAGGFLYGIPIGVAIGIATAGGTKKGELLYSR